MHKECILETNVYFNPKCSQSVQQQIIIVSYPKCPYLFLSLFFFHFISLFLSLFSPFFFYQSKFVGVLRIGQTSRLSFHSFSIRFLYKCITDICKSIGQVFPSRGLSFLFVIHADEPRLGTSARLNGRYQRD